MTIDQKLDAVRSEMRKEGIHACIVADADPHQSEYVADCYKARKWISGFGGSAGTVVITLDRAGLWTDSRYYLEAEEALSGTSITLFRDGMTGVPSYLDWIGAHLTSGQIVGVNDEVTSIAQYRNVETSCSAYGITVTGVADPISPVWRDRPSLPKKPIFIHEERFAGRSRREKLADLRRKMAARRVDVFVTAALDDVAWLFNIRGSDVEFNPVAMAYAAVTAEQAMLFIDTDKVPVPVRQELSQDGVEIREYDAIGEFLQNLSTEFLGKDTLGPALALSPEKTAYQLLCRAPDSVRIVEETSYVTQLKARKNPVEQDHLRKTMVRDGVAMERFLYWLETHLGRERITELTVSAKLREFRAQDALFVGESFQTIAGFGSHGAVVHYGPTPESDIEIAQDGLLLVDSGGQYLDGTTDITRVVPLGIPPMQAAVDYTVVLKAHIALATAEFPEGTCGPQLDTLARAPLWREGMMYGHGTGHGVGYFLNVHEGPQRIGSQPQMVPLEPGMYVSNEPGVYRPGKYGIRIENLVLVQEGPATAFGRFLRLETITLCHLEPDLIDVSYLSESEKDWINAYQRMVYNALSPHLLEQERQWLRDKTRAL